MAARFSVLSQFILNIMPERIGIVNPMRLERFNELLANFWL
jgi:hypothetical protein